MGRTVDYIPSKVKAIFLLEPLVIYYQLLKLLQAKGSLNSLHASVS